jgi:hypothetical protein
VLRDRELFATSLVAAGAIDARDVEIARIASSRSIALYNQTPQEVAGLDFTQHFWRLRDRMVRLRSFACRPAW